ncbi:coiled-coil domain-containing protein 166 isoform X1 [Misgurnus anguillicaudatus]|uniref:coiled-coil domain-containing protein 166 isoform X1 n=1 Tax=Misgurnus anguillicaudatus TaxID=75329 RepID=UPI003CCF5A74
MSSKKAKKPEAEQHVDASAADESHREMLLVLQQEHDALTDNLNALKIRLEQLRRENEFLQNEADKTSMESKEYITYLSKRAEKRQNAKVTLSTQSHLELEELKRQRQKMQEEHEKQTNELKRKIMQKENDLALLNKEITDLKELKTLQQQQTYRIAELEKELTAMQCHHSESMVAHKADLLKDKRNYEQQAKDKLQNLNTSTISESSRCLMTHIKNVFEENQHLSKTLKQLVQSYHDLYKQQDLLQTKRQQLLLERDYVQWLHCQRFSSHSKPTTSNTQNP